MNHKFKEYIEVEIPHLKKYSLFLKPIMLWRIRSSQPSYDAVYMIRYCLLFSQKNFFKKYICAHYKKLLVYRYGIHFSVTPKTQIGKGLFFPHPSSIIIGADVSIGENCTIYQNVTIGGARVGDAQKSKYPSIGADCILYAGSKVLGDIAVADGTKVGANAVLLKNTEPFSTYAGVPAQRIK